MIWNSILKANLFLSSSLQFFQSLLHLISFKLILIDSKVFLQFYDFFRVNLKKESLLERKHIYS
ncbi:MAG: hypothetical protein DRO88_04335 [Promethearchaeia archaeon]|nr:MAG: hypothetical protein DRO88_04335 [Candidatus Lokiarchaeia archaeon]